jgi:pimeloyl-ACP methyl ester carboxylesterase
MAFCDKGQVRIHYQEAGSGFPLFVIPGGGQNSTIGFMSDWAPFNAIEEFKDEYRCIRPTCATHRAASLPGRSRWIGRGTPTPTTTSPSWITSASGPSW